MLCMHGIVYSTTQRQKIRSFFTRPAARTEPHSASAARAIP